MKKTHGKRILSSIFVLLLIFGLAVPASAADLESTQKVFTEKGVVLNSKTTTGVSGELPPAFDPVNDMINASKELKVQQMLKEEALKAASGITPKAGVTTKISCVARAQETNYWCGVACSEQVLRASESGGHTMSLANGTYQRQLANVIGIGTTSATEPHQHVAMLNAKTAGSFRWGYRHIPGNGAAASIAVLEKANQTIGRDRKCCIVFADTMYYDYYPMQIFHWVTLNGMTQQSFNTPVYFYIVDPHYNVAYRGSHTIDVVNFGWAIERYNSKPNLVW